jgi:uncharacterized protein (DUF4415 family)
MMTKQETILKPSDPASRDDAPKLGAHFFTHARLRDGDKTLREATGTMARRGRPPLGDAPKVQQSLRLSQEVLAHFRETGPGWQARIDQVLLDFVHDNRGGDVGAGGIGR